MITDEEYREKQRYIWKNYVPPGGQANTVQGELLRALYKLADEAQRNGNINWDSGHEILAFYILTTIKDAKFLDDEEYKQLEEDIATILDFHAPYTDDDLYKRIAHIIVDFYIKYPEPIMHKHNSDLHR